MVQLPRIEDLGQRARPTTQAPSVRADPGAFGAPGRGLARAAEKLADVADEQYRRIEIQNQRAGHLEALKTASQTEADWATEFEKAKVEAPDGAEGFTDSMLKRWEETSAEKLKAASPYARDRLELAFTQMGGRLKAQSFEFETASRLSKQVRDVESVVDLNANGVRSDFSRLETGIAMSEEAIANSSLTAAAKEKALIKAREQVTFSGMEGLIERDPVSAQKMLNDGTWDKTLDPARKSNLLSRAGAEINRREREAEQARRQAEMDLRIRKAELRDEGRYYVGALQDGVMPAGVDDFMARAVRVDPGIATTIQNAKLDLTWRRGLAQLPPEAIAEEVALVRQQAESSKDPVQAAALANRLETGRRALDTAVSGLQRDPLAYAEATGAVAQTELTPSSLSDPSAIAKRSAALVATRERYGVQPSFLKKGEAKGIVDVLTSDAPADQKVALRLSLDNLPPEVQGSVFRDLEANGLKGNKRALVYADERIVGRLADVLATEPGALRKAIGTTEAGAVDDSLNDVFEDFSRSAQNLSGGLSATADAAEAARLYSYSLVAGGMKPAEAARKAAEDIVLHQWDLVGQSNNQVARAPKGAGEKATTYGDALLKRLPDTKLVLPADVSGRGDTEQLRQIAEQNAARGFWQTMPDGSGWMRIGADGNPVLVQEGEGVSVNFGRRAANVMGLRFGDVARMGAEELARLKREGQISSFTETGGMQGDSAEARAARSGMTVEQIREADRNRRAAALDDDALFVAGKRPTGMLEAGNIDLARRPSVQNSDGSISTVRSMSVDFDGKEYLLPTVSDDGRILSDEEAIDLFKKTGKHLGVFNTPDAATSYAEQLHDQQERLYGKKKR